MTGNTKRNAPRRRLTARQREDLAGLAALEDAAIDRSDAAEVQDWEDAVVGRFYRPVKASVTLRLDRDVLAWLRRRGPGYQTRINQVLRRVMEAQMGRKHADRSVRRVAGR